MAIGDLSETWASPAIRSALYRLAADSGVELLGSITDHRGRPGVTGAMTFDYGGVDTPETMSSDPDDGALLEEQDSPSSGPVAVQADGRGPGRRSALV